MRRRAAEEEAVDGTLPRTVARGHDMIHVPPTDPSGLRRSYLLLTLLYMLQGVVMGFACGTIPYVLRSRGLATFSQLGLLGLAAYPYSLKVAWSPLVDAYGVRGVGVRKTWIIGAQLVMGSLMLWLGGSLDATLDSDTIPFGHLLFVLTCLTFATATQDVAVDGWAIELLTGPSRRFASNCQSTGMSLGFFTSFTALLALSSAEFSDGHLRAFVGAPASGEPLVSLGTFAQFWGAVTLMMTAVVMLKHEDVSATMPPSASTVFREMWQVARRPHMTQLIAFLLLYRIPLGVEVATPLKLLDRGLSSSDVALGSLLDVPVEFAVGYAAAHSAARHHPLELLRYSVTARLALLVVSAALVWTLPLMPGGLAFWLAALTRVLGSVARVVGFVAQGAYFAQIADPAIGATFMTLLQTFANLGGSWPQSLAMQVIDALTVRRCGDDASAEPCPVAVDGYYVLVVLSVVLGVVAMPRIRRALDRLRAVRPAEWLRDQYKQ